MGTLNYMAPEQVRGERADQRSDVFSVGVVLYELLGGRKAFEGDSVASTLYKILQEEPEPLWKIDPPSAARADGDCRRAPRRSRRDERYPDMSVSDGDLDAYRQQLLGTGDSAAVSSVVHHTGPPSSTPPRAPDRSAQLGMPGSRVAPSRRPTRDVAARNLAIAAAAILLSPRLVSVGATGQHGARAPRRRRRVPEI